VPAGSASASTSSTSDSPSSSASSSVTAIPSTGAQGGLVNAKNGIPCVD
jgi:hypothetical protein